MTLLISFAGRVLELILAIGLIFIDKELVKVILYRESQFNFSRSFFRGTLKVAHFAALHASFVSIVVLIVPLKMFGFLVSFAAIELNVALSPHFQAPALAVADLATHQALDDVLFLALAGLVAHLVAFKAEFLVTFERIVRVFATENAVQSTALVGTLTSHVP